MILGVTPCDPKSEYCVQGRIIESNITGCIVELFGGSSVRIFAALGGLCLVGSTMAPVAAAVAKTSGGCERNCH